MVGNATLNRRYVQNRPIVPDGGAEEKAQGSIVKMQEPLSPMVTKMAYSINSDVPRTSLFAAITVWLLVCFFPAGAAAQGPIVLENEQLRLEVDSDHGTITRIVDKQGHIRIAPASGLADNFRLTLRAADKKNKIILGRSQKLTSKSEVDNGIDLVWSGPLVDNEGGTHNLSVRMEIRLAGPSLEFRLFVHNGTASQLAEAWYPLVGGLAGFGRGQDRGETSVMLPTASPTIKRLAMPFGEMALHYPDQMNMSYSSVYDTKSNRAMYFASPRSGRPAEVLPLLRAVVARRQGRVRMHRAYAIHAPGKSVRRLAGRLAVSRRRLEGRRADLPGVVH